MLFWPRSTSYLALVLSGFIEGLYQALQNSQRSSARHKKPCRRQTRMEKETNRTH
jgi:hypothetical protein